jgi:phosphatidylglycerophosphate synthase
MKIYNYLFYKTYLLSKRSGNFDDVPVLGGLLFVLPCLMFNIFTVFMLLDAWGVNTGVEFKKEYKYVFTFSLLLLLLLYYLYKGRYKKIIEKFEQKEKGKSLRPIFVIIIYYAISFGLLLLAGLYKNQDWIFAP